MPHTESPTIVFDDLGFIQEVNPALEALLGYTCEELRGQPARMLFDAEELREQPVALGDVVAGVVVRRERVARGKTGSYHPVEVEACRLESGLYRSILRDATPRQRAFEVLRANEERLRSFLQDLDVGVVVQVPGGAIIHANPRAAELLGLSEDQLLGRTSFDPRWRALRDDGSDFPGEDHPAMHVLRTGQGVRGVVMGVYRPLHEDYVWLQVNATPMTGAHGEVEAAIASFSDITADRAATAEREALIRQLKASIARVRRLEGLLPICAHCKQIRDQEGRWVQIERFVSARSDAQFSHGICPGCLDTHFPELATGELGPGG